MQDLQQHIDRLEIVHDYHPTFYGDFNNPEDVEFVADILRDKEAVVVDNDSVFAIVGDALTENDCDPFAQAVAYIKESSNLEKVFGSMLSTEEIVQLANPDLMSQETWEALKSSQDTLSGLAFVRFPISREAVACLPSSVVSHDASTGIFWMQNYDPEFKTTMKNLIDTARMQGLALPIITSLNRSGEKEIIDPFHANDHIRGMGLPVLHDSEASRLARGSYTIFEFGPAGIILRREGNINTEIFKSILAENSIVVPADVRRSAYPEHQLYKDSLGELATLTGPNLAHGLRKKLGWEI